MTAEHAIKRMAVFGFPHLGTVDYMFSKGQEAEKRELFQYTNKIQVVASYAKFRGGKTGIVDIAYWYIARVKQEDDGIYHHTWSADKLYKTRPIKTHFPEEGLTLSVKFQSFFEPAVITITKKHKSDQEEGETTSVFKTTQKELEYMAWLYSQGKVPPGVFLDLLKEKSFFAPRE